jgi:hypothetical protein
MEVIGSGKHSSLLQYSNNYCNNKLKVQAPGGNSIKQITAEIYGFFEVSYIPWHAFPA